MEQLRIPQIVTLSDLTPYSTVPTDFFRLFYQNGQVSFTEPASIIPIDNYTKWSKYYATAIINEWQFERSILGRHTRVNPDDKENTAFLAGPVEIIDSRRVKLPNGLALRSSRITRGYDDDRTIPHFSSYTIVGNQPIVVPGLNEMMESDEVIPEGADPVQVPVLVTTQRIMNPYTSVYVASVDRAFFNDYGDNYYVEIHNILARTATPEEQSALEHVIDYSNQGGFLGPVDLSLEEYIKALNPHIRF